MDCWRCRNSNPDAHKFCCEWGASSNPVIVPTQDYLKSELPNLIAGLLKDQLKDREVVEIETARSVLAKVSEWTKLFGYYGGLPIGALLLILTTLGLKSYLDISKFAERAERSEKDMETRLASAKTQIDSSLQQANQQVESTRSRGQEILAELTTLRQKVSDNSQQVTLLASKVEDITFKPSRTLTQELTRKLEAALAAFQNDLVQAGFRPRSGSKKADVVVDDQDKDNAFFDGETIHFGEQLASDAEYLWSAYFWHVLKQSNESAFQHISKASSGLAGSGYLQGSKFYYICGHQNDPLVGKNFQALNGYNPGKGYLFNIKNDLKYKKDDPGLEEEHRLGEVWGGAFWALREQLGKDLTDRLLFTAWAAQKPTGDDGKKPGYFVKQILEADQALTGGQHAQAVRNVFDRRNLL